MTAKELKRLLFEPPDGMVHRITRIEGNQKWIFIIVGGIFTLNAGILASLITLIYRVG